MQVTRQVLDEIGAGDVPWLLVLNKIDKVAQTDREALVNEFPAALLVSAKDPADVGRVRDAIIGTFEADMTDVELVVPYNAGSAIGEIHKVHVLSESYEADGVHYRVRAPKAAIDRIRAMFRWLLQRAGPLRHLARRPGRDQDRRVARSRGSRSVDAALTCAQWFRSSRARHLLRPVVRGVLRSSRDDHRGCESHPHGRR
jgi:hypothetical protein